MNAPDRNPALEWVIVISTLLFLVTAGAQLSHCATTTKNRPNSLGVEEVYTNPNVYLFGSIAEGSLLRGQSEADHYTNIRFQPYNTMSLYTETVLFCGNQAEQFNGKTGALLVTYEKRAHRMFRGVACHELESVFEVPAPKDGQ
jgi:hypothetical protein